VKLDFSGQNFEKYSCVKCHEYPCSGSGRTDGRTRRG